MGLQVVKNLVGFAKKMSALSDYLHMPECHGVVFDKVALFYSKNQVTVKLNEELKEHRIRCLKYPINVCLDVFYQTSVVLIILTLGTLILYGLPKLPSSFAAAYFVVYLATNLITIALGFLAISIEVLSNPSETEKDLFYNKRNR
jgi:hypothetical protein